MNTELATRIEPGSHLARFGSEHDIQNFMRRTAAIFKIPEDDLARPDVQASLQKATQYCMTYGYMPGLHVHMIPFNETIKTPHATNPSVQVEKKIKTYAPDMGEKAWKDSADRICQMLRISYVVDTQAMTTEEVREATLSIPGQDFTPSDAGCWARVYRSDHNELFKAVGRPYNPEWVAGFWRMKKDKWGGTDTIPNGRTPADVARRRATKNALMAVFHLVPLDEYTEAQRFRQLSAYVQDATAEPLPALPVGILHTNNGWQADENGDTWAVERPRLMAEERAKMATEPAPSVASLADVDPLDFDDEDAITVILKDLESGVVPRPRWENKEAAKAWAVDNGACANDFEATNSLKKIVTEQFDGKFTTGNFEAVMDAFYARQMEKLAEKAETEAKDPLPF